MGELMRRRAMMQAASGTPSEPGLLEQGTLDFNQFTTVIAERRIKISRNNSGADAYNVKRYFNVTDFSANTTTGTGATADISNKNSGKIIPAGASCVFAASNTSGSVNASYEYFCALLRDKGTGNIQRIAIYGRNAPANSVSWTATSDTEIGCVAIETSHINGKHYAECDLSLTVNGEEWL